MGSHQHADTQAGRQAGSQEVSQPASQGNTGRFGHANARRGDGTRGRQLVVHHTVRSSDAVIAQTHGRVEVNMRHVCSPIV